MSMLQAFAEYKGRRLERDRSGAWSVTPKGPVRRTTGIEIGLKDSYMRKIGLGAAVLFVCVTFAGAQSTDGLKRYYDHRLGYEGLAVAHYIGNLFSVYSPGELPSRDVRIQGIQAMLSMTEAAWIEGGLTILQKLRKDTRWLAGQALSEWDLEEGDVFLLGAAPDHMEENIVAMMVWIDDASGSYSYIATVITDVEELKALEW